VRIIKSISLDEDSAKIADTMPNFSHFVRECLYRHAVKQSSQCTEVKPERFKGRCNPLSKVPCFICWPNGKPSKDSVRQWSQDGLTMDWLDAQARISNQRLIDLRNINTKTPNLPLKGGGKRSFMQKLRAILGY
jgi:hypothetical protein